MAEYIIEDKMVTPPDYLGRVQTADDDDETVESVDMDGPMIQGDAEHYVGRPLTDLLRGLGSATDARAAD